MERDIHPVESVPHLTPYPRLEPEEPLRNSVRAKLFALVAVATLAIGLALTLLQPAVYRASATVLMTAPVAIDDQEQEANVQSVAIQRRILLGGEVTQQLAAAMTESGHDGVDVQFLREVLSVEPVPDTNLVEMTARGSAAELLPELVNNWIDVYLDIRALGIQESQQQTLRLVRDQLAGLDVKLEEARLALAQYREEHEITSAERQENEVMARLDGLNEALNKAIEAEVQAQAQLEAMERAIAQGERIPPESESERVDKMELQLRNLKQQLAKVTKTYTLQYVRREPRYREMPQRIAKLESDLEEIYAKGEAQQLGALRREYAAAQQAVVKLQEQLDEHEVAAAQFTNIYATHQALVEDLGRLEDLNRETQARLIEVQVNPVERYPQVSVIDRPAAESERIGPDYLLWLGASCASALLLGILSVWLYGFLGPRRKETAVVTLSGVHMYPQDVNGQLDYGGAPNPQLAKREDKLLGEDTGRRDEDQEDSSEEPPR